MTSLKADSVRQDNVSTALLAVNMHGPQGLEPLMRPGPGLAAESPAATAAAPSLSLFPASAPRPRVKDMTRLGRMSVDNLFLDPEYNKHFDQESDQAGALVKENSDSAIGTWSDYGLLSSMPGDMGSDGASTSQPASEVPRGRRPWSERFSRAGRRVANLAKRNWGAEFAKEWNTEKLRHDIIFARGGLELFKSLQLLHEDDSVREEQIRKRVGELADKIHAQRKQQQAGQQPLMPPHQRHRLLQDLLLERRSVPLPERPPPPPPAPPEQPQASRLRQQLLLERRSSPLHVVEEGAWDEDEARGLPLPVPPEQPAPEQPPPEATEAAPLGTGFVPLPQVAMAEAASPLVPGVQVHDPNHITDQVFTLTAGGMLKQHSQPQPPEPAPLQHQQSQHQQRPQPLLLGSTADPLAASAGGSPAVSPRLHMLAVGEQLVGRTTGSAPSSMENLLRRGSSAQQQPSVGVEIVEGLKPMGALLELPVKHAYKGTGSSSSSSNGGFRGGKVRGSSGGGSGSNAARRLLAKQREQEQQQMAWQAVSGGPAYHVLVPHLRYSDDEGEGDASDGDAYDEFDDGQQQQQQHMAGWHHPHHPTPVGLGHQAWLQQQQQQRQQVRAGEGASTEGFRRAAHLGAGRPSTSPATVSVQQGLHEHTWAGPHAHVTQVAAGRQSYQYQDQQHQLDQQHHQLQVQQHVLQQQQQLERCASAPGRYRAVPPVHAPHQELVRGASRLGSRSGTSSTAGMRYMQYSQSDSGWAGSVPAPQEYELPGGGSSNGLSPQAVARAAVVAASPGVLVTGGMGAPACAALMLKRPHFPQGQLMKGSVARARMYSAGTGGTSSDAVNCVWGRTSSAPSSPPSLPLQQHQVGSLSPRPPAASARLRRSTMSPMRSRQQAASPTQHRQRSHTPLAPWDVAHVPVEAMQ